MADPRDAGARDIFLFGTLLDDHLRRIVFGGEYVGRPAVLPGERAYALAGGAWPALGPGPGAHGLVVTLPPTALDRGDYYEGLFGYHRVDARLEDGAEVALWRPEVAPPDLEAQAAPQPWSLAHWQREHAALSYAAAEEAMALFGVRPAKETAQRWPMIRSRAQARLNAQAEEAPAAVRRSAGPGDVAVADKRTPYAFFFAVEEYDLRHTRFGGGLSDLITRAAFISADAVTVLPYDPVRDRVLLIEQFRLGPFARGDRNPWSLEAIAGRIDGGETPETTARREAREEAGLELGSLIRIASYYPSPGAKAEYLHNYLALADLPDDAAGLGGLADEDEDIRSHLVPFDDLMALVETGEISNGPLLLSTLDLARRRPDLRAGQEGRPPAA